MRRAIVGSAVSIIPLLMLGGCVGGGGSSARVTPASASVVAAAPLALSAAAYVAAASSIDYYEIQSAQLALERAQDPANRAFAQRTLTAHRGTSAQLSLAGRRLNLLPSANLTPEHQSMLEALKATPDFDNTYRAQQAILLRQGISLHGSFARSGKSPTLRPVASNAEQVMRQNASALRR
jgi:putative membrane protein